MCLTALTNGRIIKTVRETKGLTQNREEDFAERRSQWPRRRTSPALRLSPTASPMPTPMGTRTPPRCWVTCLLRSRSRARLPWARLVRWTRTSWTRFMSWSQITMRSRSPRRTLWRWVSPRLPRLRRLRQFCVSHVSWASLRRSWTVRRSVTRRWLPSRHTSWASCKTAQNKNILCSSPVCCLAPHGRDAFKWKWKKLTEANLVDLKSDPKTRTLVRKWDL